MEIYLDNAATTKMKKETVDVLIEALEHEYANSSSIHGKGRAAEDALEKARESMAEIIGANSDELIFTSGATEGNNQIIRSYGKPRAHLITTVVEHKSVLLPMKEAEKKGAKVDYIEVDNKGNILLDQLKEKMRKNTALVSIMMVNNETGVETDLDAVVKLIRSISKKAKIHVDGVQGFLKYPVNIREMDVDFFTVSAHKVHGPKGLGFLYVKKGQKPDSLMLGGDHEKKMRAGTVNVPGILAFDKAAERLSLKREPYFMKVKDVKKIFIDGLVALGGVRINSPLHTTSPYILNVSFLGVRGETLLHYLDNKGIYVATGSACASQNHQGSHVLEAMGLTQEEILGSIRFSFAEDTTKDDIAYTLLIIKEALQFLRRT